MGSTRDAVLAIVGMAVVTYATRASGVWLLQRVPLSRTLERGLGYLPSAVLVALIAPPSLRGMATIRVRLTYFVTQGVSFHRRLACV